MKLNPSIRKLLLVALFTAGAVLLGAGLGLDRPSLAVAGVAAWMLVLLAVAWGLRYRLGSLEERLIQGGSQMAELGRAYSQNYGSLSDRLSVLRKSQLKLHSRVATAEIAGIKRHREMVKPVGDVSDRVEKVLHAAGETQELILRSYRETHAEWEAAKRMLEARAQEAAALEQWLSRQLQHLEEGAHANSLSLETVNNVLGKTSQSVGKIKQESSAMLKTIDRLRGQVAEDTEALLQLQEAVPLEAPRPMLGGWAMDPVAMLQLAQLVLRNKPAVVLECGSGASTVWLASAMRKAGGGRVISLEHSPEFAARTRMALSEHGLDDVAEVRLATFEKVRIGDEEFDWYAPGALEGVAAVDLLLVDGPPRATGPLARYPALPLIGPLLAPAAVVVFDDIHRGEEKQIVERWKAEYPRLQTLDDIGPRTTAFHWRDDASATERSGQP